VLPPWFRLSGPLHTYCLGLGGAEVKFRGRGNCRARQSTASALFSDYYFVDDHTVQEILCNSSDPYEL
jgi:hypothetical protein